MVRRTWGCQPCLITCRIGESRLRQASNLTAWDMGRKLASAIERRYFVIIGRVKQDLMTSLSFRIFHNGEQ